MSDEEILLRIGAHIREVRLAKNLTYNDLAEAIDEDIVYVIKLEAGEYDVKIEYLFLIADKFGVTIADLFKGLGL